MAQLTNTFDTYAAIGVREDLEDKIYMVSPEKTPVVSAGMRMNATAKFHEWQRDTLATPNKDNADIEGNDVTGASISATNRVGNTTQTFTKVIIVATTLDKSKKAGRSSELKYQIAKGYSEIKRDMEAMAVSINPAVLGNSSTARKSGGLGVLLYTNALHNGAGATAAHTSGAPTTANTAGTNRAFTEALIKSGMQNIYAQSGEMPSFMSMTPSHKGTFSGFTGIALNRYDIPKGKQAVIVGGADLYASDFGPLAVVPNYVQTTAASSQVYILNPETYGMAFLQSFGDKDLPENGLYEKAMVFAEATLVVTAERANCKIDNLTP